MIDLSGCAASMKPPCPSLVCETAVQWGPAEVCLNEASVAPAWMSCSDMVPGTGLDVVGAVAHKITSCSCIATRMGESIPRGESRGTRRRREIRLPGNWRRLSGCGTRSIDGISRSGYEDPLDSASLHQHRFDEVRQLFLRPPQ